MEQRELVRFLVDCWPESIYETNHHGQTAEDMATGSVVKLLLQECRAGPLVKKHESNHRANEKLRRGSVAPMYHGDLATSKAQSLFKVSSSSLSNGKIKTKTEQSRSNNVTVIG